MQSPNRDHMDTPTQQLFKIRYESRRKPRGRIMTHFHEQVHIT
jgi:hypothetical protein